MRNHLTWHVRNTAIFFDIHGENVVLSFGLVLSRRARLWMYSLGTMKGHNGLRAISKIAMWVPIVLCSGLCYVCKKEGCLYNFCGQSVSSHYWPSGEQVKIHVFRVRPQTRGCRLGLGVPKQ